MELGFLVEDFWKLKIGMDAGTNKTAVPIISEGPCSRARAKKFMNFIAKQMVEEMEKGPTEDIKGPTEVQPKKAQIIIYNLNEEMGDFGGNQREAQPQN